MGGNPQTGRSARFGAFEVDLRAGELRKSGVKLKLQEQPFRVLAVLVERRGEVVTREELRQQLWQDDTFVDFDHGLNTAINKIREALGDSASHPRFVETLPRRGYRFVGAVEGLGAKDGARSLWRKRPVRWVAIAALLLLAIGAVVWLRPSTEPDLPPPVTVPFTSFVGRERAPAFSPDGEEVAFVWNGEQYLLYTASADHAFVDVHNRLARAVNGPLTAGIIPWGQG
ncbi:MAG: hypothetical protein GY953_30290, partial [bacterium]|nr:hypothetical protein [bacterium]